MLHLLRRPQPPTRDGRPLRVEIAEALRGRLDLDGDAVVRVVEVGCRDPGCPDLETVAVLLRPGRWSEAAKVGRPMAGLVASDLDGLAAELAAKAGVPVRGAP